MTLIRALHPFGRDAPIKGRQDPSRAFVFDRPAPEGTIARVRAKHPLGDYALPFRCRRVGGRWVNDRTSMPIEIESFAGTL